MKKVDLVFYEKFTFISDLYIAFNFRLIHACFILWPSFWRFLQLMGCVHFLRFIHRYQIVSQCFSNKITNNKSKWMKINKKNYENDYLLATNCLQKRNEYSPSEWAVTITTIKKIFKLSIAVSFIDLSKYMIMYSTKRSEFMNPMTTDRTTRIKNL